MVFIAPYRTDESLEEIQALKNKVALLERENEALQGENAVLLDMIEHLRNWDDNRRFFGEAWANRLAKFKTAELGARLQKIRGRVR